MLLKIFCELLPRDKLVILGNEDTTNIYYAGPAKSIPEIYNEYIVIDAGISLEGELLFELRKPQS